LVAFLHQSKSFCHSYQGNGQNCRQAVATLATVIYSCSLDCLEPVPSTVIVVPFVCRSLQSDFGVRISPPTREDNPNRTKSWTDWRATLNELQIGLLIECLRGTHNSDRKSVV